MHELTGCAKELLKEVAAGRAGDVELTRSKMLADISKSVRDVSLPDLVRAIENEADDDKNRVRMAREELCVKTEASGLR